MEEVESNVTGIDLITLDTMNRARCGHSQAKKRSQEVLRLLKLPGQETQLSVLGTLELVLYTTSTEGYGTCWNMAEQQTRRRESSRTRWKQTETTGRNYTTQDTTSFCWAWFTRDSYSYGHVHPRRLLMPDRTVTICLSLHSTLSLLSDPTITLQDAKDIAIALSNTAESRRADFAHQTDLYAAAVN
jgi:hypothetical protein